VQAAAERQRLEAALAQERLRTEQRLAGSQAEAAATAQQLLQAGRRVQELQGALAAAQDSVRAEQEQLLRAR
jgi:hypothetical protein